MIPYTFRTLNSIHPELSETYVYLFTQVQFYKPMIRQRQIASRNLFKLTILHYTQSDS